MPFRKRPVARPRLETLSDRCTPAVLVGLTAANQLVTFDSATPGTLTSTVAVTGLGASENLVGVDFRPATGVLYGIGTTNQLYTINTATGAAAKVGTPFSPAVAGTAVGIDFNPAVDKLRVVTNSGQNLRINADTGAVAATDTPLAFDATSYNTFFGTTTAAPAPQIGSAGYTLNPDATGKTLTTLFDIDTSKDILVRQGGPSGDPSPNGGALFVVGNLGFDATAEGGFDIVSYTDQAFATSNGKLYGINLATGAGTATGTIGDGTVTIRGLSVAPVAAGAGSQALVALTSTNQLVSFNSASPGVVFGTVAVTGLGTGENLVGIDFRPATGKLYGIGTANQLYTIDTATGVATAVGTPFTPALAGTAVGIDFNPAVDKLRVVTSSGQNLRLNADTGVVVGTDTPVAYDPDSYAAFFGTAAPAPQIGSVAYTLNTDAATAKTVTTMYGIDTSADVLVIQGGPDSDPSPNGGVLTIVDQLGFDASAEGGFDIVAGTDQAFTTANGKLYGINLTLGTGAPVGVIGSGSATITGLAVAPVAAGAGTLNLSAATYTFSDGRGPVAVTVTRTGGATGAVTVAYATADGTGVAGTDYFTAAGTLSFAEGVTSQTVFLTVPAGVGPATAKTFTLAISAPTGGAALGTTATATVTVPAATATGTTGKYYAAATGAGASVVINVYEATAGTLAFTISPFESSFTGGATVATGDVDGDGVDDIIVGTGVGGSPRVQLINGATKAVDANFFAYEETFRGGVNVAAADVNGDGFADILIGSGVGGGPRVRVINGTTSADATPGVLADFFAYEESFRGGVNVAGGEITGDGFADIFAGAGFGGGPRIRTFNGATLAPIADFFAYESTFRNGVTVAVGDVNGDGILDAIAGAGPGGGPAVQTFNATTGTGLFGFFAGESSARGGVRVTATDVNNDGTDEVITGAGSGGAPTVGIYAAGTLLSSFNAFDAGFTGGVFVG